MTSGILIPSKTYSKETAMKFTTVNKIWRDVDYDVGKRRTVKASLI